MPRSTLLKLDSLGVSASTPFAWLFAFVIFAPLCFNGESVGQRVGFAKLTENEPKRLALSSDGALDSSQ